MPLGATLAVIGVAGGFAASKAFGGNSSSGQTPPSNTSSLVDQATKNQPPNAIQASSTATDQANIAALKQRKKAAAGDTLLTPSDTGRSGTAGAPAPATLIGSK